MWALWSLPAACAILALANRLRGGWLGDQIGWGTNVARFFGWSVPFAALYAFWAGLGGIFLLLSLAMAVAAWAGCTAGQFGGLSMGHKDGGTTGWRAWAGMGAWGFLRLAPPAGILYLAEALGAHGSQPLWLLFPAVLCPIVYDLVWYAPPAFYKQGFGYGHGPLTGYDPPELAEAVWGAIVAPFLWLAIFC